MKKWLFIEGNFWNVTHDFLQQVFCNKSWVKYTLFIIVASHRRVLPWSVCLCVSVCVCRDGRVPLFQTHLRLFRHSSLWISLSHSLTNPIPASVLSAAVTSVDPWSLLDAVQVFSSPALMGSPLLMCVIMTEQVISSSRNWMVLFAVLTEVTVKGSCPTAKSKHEVSPHDWLFMLWSMFAFLWHSDWK